MRTLLLLVWIFIVSLFSCPSTRAQTISPPRSFEAIATSETQINLYWLAPTDPGTSGYSVARDGVKLAELPGATTAFSDTGLSPNTTYTYTVRALKGGNLSDVRTYRERTFAPWPSSSIRGRNAVPRADFDVVVAQASTGGVAAAIEAARRNLKVALIEPTTRVGGMPANGLSATDLRRPEHGSGFFMRFQGRVREVYAAEGVKATGMSYEPRVAHEAMKSLLYDVPGITLFRHARPIRVRAHSTEPDGSLTHVDSVIIEEITANGTVTGRRAELRASVFIDATDCGDVAAWAGATYRLGREARTNREPHNGLIYYDRANDRALPGSSGAADNRIMAYSYLLTVKDYGPGADRTIPKPDGYRREDFVHTPAWKDSWAVTSGRMPGDKLELNQHPQGGDIQQINYRYPLDNYVRRGRIEQIYKDHVLGYLYYIQTEQGQKQVGLPDDEYRDTGGFPPLLYVREGRRIIGDQLPNEMDVTLARSYSRPESIGIGDYPMDSHAVRPKTDWNTPDMGEGEWWLYKQTPVHQLPIGVMVPRDLENVFVTTAVSSTHVSFGTYRLEPVRMAFGQAAGIAAALCIRFHLTAHQVPARQVQDELLPHADNPLGDRAIKLSYYPDISTNSPDYRGVQYLTCHGITLNGDNFKPNALTSRAELLTVLTQLAARSTPANTSNVADALSVHAYLGWPADRSALDELRAAAGAEQPVTRGQFAHWLVRLLPHECDPGVSRQAHYSDASTPGASSASYADGLYSIGIDSVLWDGWRALGSDGKLIFRPNEPLTHTQLFAALFIAQVGLGPLFDDLPSETLVRR